MERLQHIKVVLAVATPIVLLTLVPGVNAGSRAGLNREAVSALNHLYSLSHVARRMGEAAKAVLVFPNIDWAKSNNGAQHIYGALLANGRANAYYKLVGSYTVPSGVRKFGYALFFMSEDDLAEFRNSAGREIATRVQATQPPEQQQSAPDSVKPDAGEPVDTGSSAASTVWHSSPIVHRPAMNDQQQAAPRPDDLMLAPAYGGFAPGPEMSVPRAPSTATQRKGVYAFAFGDVGLIPGLSLSGAKVVPMKTTENQ
jgi:hypothetical protein